MSTLILLSEIQKQFPESKVKRFGNKSLFLVTRTDGSRILMSYRTAIGWINQGVVTFTQEKYSVATSKHVTYLWGLYSRQGLLVRWQ